MKLSHLLCLGYRRFADLEMNFASRLSVIVGVNGAGKSTILSAISKMLSWYVRRLVSPTGTGSGYPIASREISNGGHSASLLISVTPQDSDGEVIWILTKMAPGAPVASRLRRKIPESIQQEIHQIELELSQKEQQFSQLQETSMKDLTRYVKSIREKQPIDSVPVIVHYSVNRAVVEVPLKVRKRHDFSVLSVYDDAFGRSADFRRFFEWFREYDDLENERIVDAVKRGKDPREGACRELAAVTAALKAFLPEFKEWKIRRSPMRMEVKKGREVLNIEQLSDGEKCVIALVGDLARRLVIANPKMRNPLSGGGIVLIDEIELHLHPSWQMSVLPRLLRTFPGMQFVVTTHSPLVLAQLNSLLFEQQRNKSLEKKREIEVFALNRKGEVSSLLDPETGLLMPSEMDEAVQKVDEEFAALLEKC